MSLDVAEDASSPLLPLTSLFVSYLMIWAALNAFPFGLITLWEDRHPYEDRARDLSPLATWHDCSFSSLCVCVSWRGCVLRLWCTQTQHFPLNGRFKTAALFLLSVSVWAKKSNQLQIHSDRLLNLASFAGVFTALQSTLTCFLQF